MLQKLVLRGVAKERNDESSPREENGKEGKREGDYGDLQGTKGVAVVFGVIEADVESEG
jgi:hypothetical protein